MPQVSAVLMYPVVGISAGDTVTARCHMVNGPQNFEAVGRDRGACTALDLAA